MKTCPKCNEPHEKPGKFCSRTCSNSRTWSEEDKLKKSISKQQFDQSAAGIENRRHLSKIGTGRTRTIETKLKIAASRTPEWRAKMAKLASERPTSDGKREKCRQNAIRRGFGGHTSKQRLLFTKKDGTSIHLQSSYEVEFATLLERLDVSWSRPDPLWWVDNEGVKHRYYADFKIGEVYIDTKNDYLAIKDKLKIEAVCHQNSVDVRIVTKENITEQYIRSLIAG